MGRSFWITQLSPLWLHECLKSENLSQLWSERGVTTEKDSEWWDVAGFEDERREPWAKECGEPEEAGKKPDSLFGLQKGMYPWQHLDLSGWDPCQSSDLKSCKINLCSFKPLNLHLIVTTAAIES